MQHIWVVRSWENIFIQSRWQILIPRSNGGNLRTFENVTPMGIYRDATELQGGLINEFYYKSYILYKICNRISLLVYCHGLFSGFETPWYVWAGTLSDSGSSWSLTLDPISAGTLTTWFVVLKVMTVMYSYPRYNRYWYDFHLHAKKWPGENKKRVSILFTLRPYSLLLRIWDQDVVNPHVILLSNLLT